MQATKVDIFLDEGLLQRLDHLIVAGSFRDRNEAVQTAVAEKIERMNTSLLVRECAKLDPHSEQEMADESLSTDLASWPKY
jgi:metal-responsive CopG/Arc/MetJ family transcriptional regulator